MTKQQTSNPRAASKNRFLSPVSPVIVVSSTQGGNVFLFVELPALLSNPNVTGALLLVVL